MNAERYSRQTQLSAFGEIAQEMLFNAKVLVVGAGGLGIPALTYLNAMGVGTLGVIDNDIVSLSNLQRQVAYHEADLGKLKVSVLVEKLEAQNSVTKINSYSELLSPENALEIIDLYDVIVDASDNFATRYLINDACAILNKPLIYGALHGFEGQVSVFNYKNGPTYRCLFPVTPKDHEVPNCNENGVLGVIPGIIGNLQALETVKVITGIGEVLSGKLLLFNGLNQNYQKINFKKVEENGKITKLNEDYGFKCEILIPSIDAASFEAILKTKSIQVIDVRTTDEFETYHLKNSIHIPLLVIENEVLPFNFNKETYVICGSGTRSQQAIKILQKSYLKTKFINVAGGLQKIKKLCQSLLKALFCYASAFLL